MKSHRRSLTFMCTISFLMIITNSCKKDVQLPEVTTGTISDITSTSAIIDGNTNSDGGGYVLSRGICWSNFLTEPDINEDNISLEGYGAGSFGGYMTNLTPGTTYYARAYATNAVGTGYGSVVSFTTTGNIINDIVFNPGLIYDNITDTAGNVYKTVQIENQTWMAENLKTTKFKDGTDIPNFISHDEWNNQQTPGYCWYLNDIKHKDLFGALYNWHTVNTGKLCPRGWHVPLYEEWTTLFNYLGTNYEIGNYLREAGTSHWLLTDSNVTNSSGFTALPGGWRNIDNTNFGDLGYTANFWAAPETDSNINTITFFYMGSWEGIFLVENLNTTGNSVRCLKD